jgi:protein-disulfide isomerase
MQGPVAEGRVRVVYRHLAFLSEESSWAAEASECAAEQGRFWEYHDALYQRTAGRGRGVFTKDNLKRYAGEVGLAGQSFNACVDGGRYAAAVKSETEEGKRKGVSSTPTLFVNKTMVKGVPSWEQLLQLVQG